MFPSTILCFFTEELLVQLYERVRRLASHVANSQKAIADALGLSRARFQGYLNQDRQDNLWPLLAGILTAYPAVSREWLYFGEGPMLKADGQDTGCTGQVAAQPIPVVGLVSCGVDGWEQATPSALSASTPVFGAHWLAAIAFGDSMTPAGIHPGHICYCDPEQIPLAGDAVYVIRKDGLATIKAFVGPSETGPEWTRLKGWTPANGSGFRREFFIDLLTKDVEKIAPVIYVRRRI